MSALGRKQTLLSAVIDALRLPASGLSKTSPEQGGRDEGNSEKPSTLHERLVDESVAPKSSRGHQKDCGCCCFQFGSGHVCSVAYR